MALCALPQALPCRLARRSRRLSPAAPRPACRPRLLVRARGGDQPEPAGDARGGGFFTGVLVGGAVFGALGLLFAPQISSALLRGRDALRSPQRAEEEDPLEEQRKSLNDKIAELNAAIDEFAQEARQSPRSC